MGSVLALRRTSMIFEKVDGWSSRVVFAPARQLVDGSTGRCDLDDILRYYSTS
jgi:hypothetical protein